MEVIQRAWLALLANRTFVLSALSLGVGVQVVRGLNRYFSQRALNNGVANSHWDWTKEVVVVTGGSSGVGAALVARLAKRGIKTLILDVNAPAASEPNENVHFYKVDISDIDALSATAARIRTEHGPVSVLINNAGISTPSLLLEKPMADVRRLIDINLTSQFFTIKAFVPDMAARNHGHVVSVASLAAFVASPGVVDYAATKAGLIALNNGLATELAMYHKADRVRTSIAFPGWMSTPMSRALEATGKLSQRPIDPDVLAAEIEQIVLSGKSKHVYLPRNLWALSLLQGWPHWIQTAALKSASNDMQPALNEVLGRDKKRA